MNRRNSTSLAANATRAHGSATSRGGRILTFVAGSVGRQYAADRLPDTHLVGGNSRLLSIEVGHQPPIIAEMTGPGYCRLLSRPFQGALNTRSRCRTQSIDSCGR